MEIQTMAVQKEEMRGRSREKSGIKLGKIERKMKRQKRKERRKNIIIKRLDVNSKKEGKRWRK